MRKTSLPHSAASGNTYQGFRYVDQKAICAMLVSRTVYKCREEVGMNYDAVFIDVDGTLLWVGLGLEGCAKLKA